MMKPVSLIVLWLGLILLVLLRTRQGARVWPVLLSALGVQIVLAILERVLFFISPEILAIFSQILLSLNVGMAVLLIFSGWLALRSRFGVPIGAMVILTATSALVIILNNGPVLSNRVWTLVVLHSIIMPALVIGLILASVTHWRGRMGLWFMLWLFSWFVLSSALLAMLIMGIMFYVEGPAHEEVVEMFASAFIFGTALGLLLCAIALPYMLLIFFDPILRTPWESYLGSGVQSTQDGDRQ